MSKMTFDDDFEDDFEENTEESWLAKLTGIPDSRAEEQHKAMGTGLLSAAAAIAAANRAGYGNSPSLGGILSHGGLGLLDGIGLSKLNLHKIEQEKQRQMSEQFRLQRELERLAAQRDDEQALRRLPGRLRELDQGGAPDYGAMAAPGGAGDIYRRYYQNRRKGLERARRDPAAIGNAPARKSPGPLAAEPRQIAYSHGYQAQAVPLTDQQGQSPAFYGDINPLVDALAAPESQRTPEQRDLIETMRRQAAAEQQNGTAATEVNPYAGTPAAYGDAASDGQRQYQGQPWTPDDDNQQGLSGLNATPAGYADQPYDFYGGQNAIDDNIKELEELYRNLPQGRDPWSYRR